jgi:hypothetical protein
MKRSDLTWGVLLVLGGIVLLLQNLGLFGSAEDLIWTILFALGGAAFLGVFAINRTFWWALIPGFTLLSLSTLMALEQLTPGGSGTWGGSIFLGGIGLSFWAIYLTHPRMWWAIIPGGILVTLAVVAGLDGMPAVGFDTGAIFFGGLALTFGLVYLLPGPTRRMTWALIPAAICAALALVVLTSSAAILEYVWPVALILIGLYFVYRTFQPAPERRDESSEQPAQVERYDDTTLPQPH